MNEWKCDCCECIVLMCKCVCGYAGGGGRWCAVFSCRLEEDAIVWRRRRDCAVVGKCVLNVTYWIEVVL